MRARNSLGGRIQTLPAEPAEAIRSFGAAAWIERKRRQDADVQDRLQRLLRNAVLLSFLFPLWIHALVLYLVKLLFECNLRRAFDF